MNALRLVQRVAVLTVVHVGINLAIGAVLLFGDAGWQFLTGAAP